MEDANEGAERDDASGEPSAGGDGRRWRRLGWAIAACAIVALAVAGAFNYLTQREPDSDGDGIADWIEEVGWSTESGARYVTDPANPDTDGDGLTDGEEAGELVSDDKSGAVYSGSTDPTRSDSDNDGLGDKHEIAGWGTEAGGHYFTDPMNPDTDGDGLSDGEEAGAFVSETEDETVYLGLSDPTMADSDDDGLDDRAEVLGWAVEAGAVYLTDPMDPDTDGDGLTDFEEAGAVVAEGFERTVFAGVSDPTKADSDDDGLDDKTEILAWAVASGANYLTDPMNLDTDGDGLTDREEAGEPIVDEEASTVYSGVSDPTKMDSDDDGLDDRAEVLGWTVESGAVYLTNPMNPDTDGDGLTDRDEAGELLGEDGDRVIYAGFADPTRVDSDGDGLDDAVEADLGLDPFLNDTDSDGLSDYREVELLGTAADLADTDGDGLDDGYEVENQESQGLDPLWPDEKVETWTYARDFAQGAFVGELAPGDSMAWLAGNLASGGASFIPGVGWVAGGVADLRDAIGSAIQDDWVGAGFSMVGLVPAAGDAAAVGGKVAKFVARNPALVPAVGALVTGAKWIPDHIKISTIKASVPSWDRLRHLGGSEKGLARLAGAKVDLERIAGYMARDGHIPGEATDFMMTGRAGERHLVAQFEGASEQVTYSTSACGDACNPIARIFDVLVDNIAHESKVGPVSLSASVKKQIESDAFLIDQGKIDKAIWHFYPSGVSNKLGPTEELLDFLDSHGIYYTIHLPK